MGKQKSPRKSLTKSNTPRKGKSPRKSLTKSNTPSKATGKQKSPRRSLVTSTTSSKDVSSSSTNSSTSSRSIMQSSEVRANKKVTLDIGRYRSEYTIKQLREIERLQKLLHLIPKLPFSRVLREILQQYGQYRMSGEAIVGLHEAAELYLTHYYEDANKCCLHAKRVTLKPIDMQLVGDLRKPFDKVGQL